MNINEQLAKWKQNLKQIETNLGSILAAEKAVRKNLDNVFITEATPHGVSPRDNGQRADQITTSLYVNRQGRPADSLH